MQFRRKDGAERGAALVEMAIALPVLVILLTGIIDFGMVLSDQISLRQGVREGARQAAVADFGSSCTATGTNADRTKLVCLTKARTDVDDVRVYIKLAPASGTTPVPTTPTVGQAVIVCAAAPMESLSGFWSPVLADRYLTSETRMRVEVASTLTAGGDVDPSGEGWAWCS
jgi:Flp pilus assembly protein TadG